MANYTRPDVYSEEVSQVSGPIVAARTGFGMIQAITQKGPLGSDLITRTRSFDAWKRIHGTYEVAARGDAAYEAEMFFKEGGFELLTNRVGHYTSVDTKTSYTGVAAYNTTLTEGVAATAAQKLSAVGPFVGVAGMAFGLDVDNVGAATVTFDATAAYVIDTTTYPVADQDGKTVKVVINGITQTVLFSGATTLLAQVINQMNAQLTGVQVADDGGQVKITTDKEGTDATISIDGTGTSALTWAAPVASTGDCGDILAITAAEAKTVIEADTTASVTVNGDGTFYVVSPTTGAASELDFQAGTGLSPFGFSVQTIVGTAAGATFSTLKLNAGYLGYDSPGTAGNSLKKKITHNKQHPSAGVNLDMAADYAAGETVIQVVSLQGLVAGSVLKVWDGSNTEYPIVSKVRSEVAAGAVSFYIDLVSAMSNSYLKAASRLESREFDVAIYEGDVLLKTYSALSLNSDSDNYYVTVLNDDATGSEFVVATDLVPAIAVGARLPAEDTNPVSLSNGVDETTGLTNTDWIGSQTGGTGLYAWDTVREFSAMCTVGNNNAVVIHAADQYAKSRIFLHYVGYTSQGMTGTEAVAFRNSTLGLDSSFSFLYSGGAKVYDPIGVGSAPKRSISAVGGIMGLYARVDTLPIPNGGPWNAPAGDGDYGTFKSALDVATVYNDHDHGLMNDAGICVIRKFGNLSPVKVWGQRTLYANPDKKWDSIPVRRAFQFFQKSIIDSTRWTVFKNNDFRLWDKLVGVIEGFFREQIPKRAFPTTDAKKAFKVRCGIPAGTMTQTDANEHRTICEVGIATQKPNEFTIFQFAQFEGGSSVTEL